MMTFSQFLIEKPLTPQQRIARSRQMKKLAPKLAMKRKMAAKKKAPPEKLKKRAQAKARDIIRKKFIKDKNYNSMSYGEKISVDKKVQAKSAAIKKIARKLLPGIKKAESDRLTKLKGAFKGKTNT
tara:strand:+ start:635 stop:1012 length:378 start_codon:yes stop_codon:yes gene_type:complete